MEFRISFICLGVNAKMYGFFWSFLLFCGIEDKRGVRVMFGFLARAFIMVIFIDLVFFRLGSRKWKVEFLSGG